MREHRASKSFRDLSPLLTQIIAQADPHKDVIVLDIDATVLYNTNKESIVGAVPNFKVQPLYDLARNRRIPVHFVTARVGTKENRLWTLKQLRAMGFDWFDSLFMRPPHVEPTPVAVAQYKLNARRAITASGQTRIILNMGDQWTDLMLADVPGIELLDRTFPQQHVMFKPPAPQDARIAVKLYETRS